MFCSTPPGSSFRLFRWPTALFALLSILGLGACHRRHFPSYAADYREFAYVSDGGTGTVTVLDLVHVQGDRTLQVGRQPVSLAVNPPRREVYAVNAGSDSVSVIDAESNRVAATIGVHRAPASLGVAPDGRRAYVVNTGSNLVSVLDLEHRREIGIAATGEAPGLVRVAPDNRVIVVSNRTAGSVSLYTVEDAGPRPLRLREAFAGCPGAGDIAILPDSTKALIACTASHQVMVLWLGQPATSWRGKQDATLQQDHLLTFLDVGKGPVHLALQPNGNEVFSSNLDSNSLSELSTWTNEVLGTYPGVMRPARGVISRDNNSLWVTDQGADSASLYSIDDGRVVASVRTGSRPDALAFSADEHLLLVADSGSADVAVVRLDAGGPPTLFTLLPVGAQPNDIAVMAFHGK